MDMHALIHSGEIKTNALSDPVIIVMPGERAETIFVTAAEVRAKPEVARNLDQ